MIITYDWKFGTDKLNLHNTACHNKLECQLKCNKTY